MRWQRLQYRFAVVLSGAAERRVLDPSWMNLTSVRPGQTLWHPATDVYELPDRYQIRIDLAGVDHEELDLILYDDAVVVIGQRRLPQTAPGAIYHRAEIRQGPFRVEVALPGPIDADNVTIECDRGFLLMNVGKAVDVLRSTRKTEHSSS
jgi:HSP20 family protein